MMSVVARWCHVRYSSRMTEFSPLAYVASLVAFALIVAYVAALDWSPEFRQASMPHLRTIAGIPAAVAMWLSGIGVWIALGIAALLLSFAWSLADLWYPPLAVKIDLWLMDGIGRYASRRAYRPRYGR